MASQATHHLVQQGAQVEDGAGLTPGVQKTVAAVMTYLAWPALVAKGLRPLPGSLVPLLLFTVALACEYVDSSLGMGYGTTLTPVLLLAAGGLSGGGYGPLVTSGQVIFGVPAKSAVAITSLAEGITCLAGPGSAGQYGLRTSWK